jgi:hypothetical protein
MTANFPTAVWDGSSGTRPDGGVNRGLDGTDWQQLVTEIQAMQVLLDSIGVSTAGVFATSDPDKGKRLFTNTLVLTLGGNAAAEDTPNKWDKTTDSRPSGDDLRAPDYDDWRELISQITALEARVQPLAFIAGGLLPTTEPATVNYLWANGTNEVQSLAQIASTSGTWTLTLTLPNNVAKTTTALAFNATGATVQTAVDVALAGLTVNGVAYTAGDVAVTGGAINAGAQTITYSGASVKNTNVAEVTTADVDLNDATPPVESTTTPGVLGVVTISDEAGAHTNVLWDGTSSSRPDADVRRGPDYQDYEEARLKIRAMQDLLVVIGFAADGGLPTTDPAVRGEWWTNTNIVTVSAGAA